MIAAIMYPGKAAVTGLMRATSLPEIIIDINALKGTLMACEPESMELEEEFSAAMAGKRFKIHFRENVVHFEDPETKKDVLIFKIPDENEVWSFIGGKKWKLIQMYGIIRDYGNAMLQFDVKGKK